MIVQEDVPYTKEEVKAMVNTIHDLREKVSQLGWHPASELLHWIRMEEAALYMLYAKCFPKNMENILIKFYIE